MMKKSMLKGLPQVNFQENTICVGYQYGKSYQRSYKDSKFKAEQPLQLIHSYVFGLLNNHQLMSEQSYMVTFIDDFLRYV